MNSLQSIDQKLAKRQRNFRPGDTVRVHVKISEGDKERIQIFEGVVIATRERGSRSAFTVRKVSYHVGVERVFPLNSPAIDKIEVVSSGKVRRGKLYYLRDLKGKAARLKESERSLAQAIADDVTPAEAAATEAAEDEAAEGGAKS